jgi:hypothetical protein
MEHDTRCPINTLPTELLAAIFSILAFDQPDHHALYVVIPAVCTRWRDVCHRLSNLPITLTSVQPNGNAERTSYSGGLCAAKVTAIQLSTIMRRVRSIASIDINTWFNHITHTVISLVPSFAPTLVSLKLNNAVCTKSICHVRLITKHCVNLVTLVLGWVCNDNCRHDKSTAHEMRCTKLRDLVCPISRPDWVQQVVALAPIQTLAVHGRSRDIQEYPLVFKHPTLVRQLSIIPYISSNESPARISALHSGLCNLVEMSITSQNWIPITDTVRRQCPNLQKITVYECFQNIEKIDYTVFQTGFANLQFLGVRDQYDGFKCTAAMFAPLQALPALTHYVTDSTKDREVAIAVLPHIKCLTWQQWDSENHAHR